MAAVLALAFSAGMVATVNPCGFAMLPAYIAYFLGVETPRSDLHSKGETAELGGRDLVQKPDSNFEPNPVLRALTVSASVTLGFLVVFGIMGLAWSSVSGLIGRRLPYITIVVGIALIIMGIAMLRGFEPLIKLPGVELSSEGRKLTSMFVYGISYAIASLSCTIPIFIGIVFTTLDRNSFAAGVATFLAYGLGMGTTLAIITLAVALTRQGILRAFRQLLPHINQISGVFLILSGLFVGYYATVEISELNSGGSSVLVKKSRELQGSLQRFVEGVGGAKLALGALIILGAALAISALLRGQTATQTEGSGSASTPQEDGI
ncbi:MAG: cytochrome c biogenesis CcdA family protein [Microthrixaceae bacterium]